MSVGISISKVHQVRQTHSRLQETCEHNNKTANCFQVSYKDLTQTGLLKMHLVGHIANIKKNLNALPLSTTPTFNRFQNSRQQKNLTQDIFTILHPIAYRTTSNLPNP
jgi:hypothetical protein